ncbi:MAG: glycosyltransferase [Flavobacteriales bacterium]|nr:glycosyltransferase [Flavobacteriales bacterium]|tara:strand:- start:982 stop:2157 length:1176 start_codon:yes stop_codon:yes gene_type:complete
MRLGILLSRFPYPLEKGDKLRAYHQIKSLSKNHDIYLCALQVGKLDLKATSELEPYCKEIKVIKLTRFSILLNLFYSLIFSKLPLQVAYFFNRRAKASIIQFFEDSKLDHLYCQLIRVAEYVKDYKSVPKTLDYMDALSRGMMRREQMAPFYLKPFIRIETTRLKRYEHFIFSEFDNLSIISEQDRDYIVHADNHKIAIIRNGVDQNYFNPRANTEARFELLFTGNMSYPPNVDCAEFLVKEVMPLVWEKKSNCKLVIAGATPSQKVKALAADRVEITGWVDDIRDMYAATKVFVAPMRIGSGLQNKLLEAMAMKLPCITSPLANNALKATNEENILIAESPQNIAEHVISLLDNKDEAQRIANNGHQFISLNYNWDSSTTQLEALFLASK